MEMIMNFLSKNVKEKKFWFCNFVFILKKWNNRIDVCDVIFKLMRINMDIIIWFECWIILLFWLIIIGLVVVIFILL